jgi:hypothetical protein
MSQRWYFAIETQNQQAPRIPVVWRLRKGARKEKELPAAALGLKPANNGR